jgi:hypothetical protein
MKTANYIPLTVAVILTGFFAAGALNAVETQIKLSGRKNIVLTPESRATVIDVAQNILRPQSDAFISQIEAVETPFSFEQPASPSDDAPVEAPEEVVINYDDASVLRAVAANFSKQVRGTLARGDTRFLQLRGGSMLRPGTSFPVTIPQAQGQTFTITITEISDDGYTLQIGEATQTIRLDASTSGGTGATRLD